jgi:hypothetical protein
MSNLLPSSIGGILAILLGFPIAYQLCVYLYNLLFHPLRRFPGPKLAAISWIPKSRQTLKGKEMHWIVDLHAKYGEVVRAGPNELSFNSAEAWKDIYGHKRAGQPTLTKDPKFYFGQSQTLTSIDELNANRGFCP